MHSASQEDRRTTLLHTLHRHILTSTNGQIADLLTDWRVFEIVSALSANERYGYGMVWDHVLIDVKDRLGLPYKDYSIRTNNRKILCTK